MKLLLSFLAVTLLNAAFLYPVFYIGVGRPVAWWLVGIMTAGGIASTYLLVRFRRRLNPPRRIDKTSGMNYK